MRKFKPFYLFACVVFIDAYAMDSWSWRVIFTAIVRSGLVFLIGWNEGHTEALIEGRAKGKR